MTDIKIDIVNFALTEGGGRRWLIGNFEAGDAVFHDACESQTVCCLTINTQSQFTHLHKTSPQTELYDCPPTSDSLIEKENSILAGTSEGPSPEQEMSTDC